MITDFKKLISNKKGQNIMIKVSQKCETLDEGIKFLMSGAKADYVRMSTSNGTKELTGYSLEQTDNWDKKSPYKSMFYQYKGLKMRTKREQIIGFS